MFYKIFKPLIFCLKAETAHNLSIAFLKYLPKFATLFCFEREYENLKNNIWGIDFANPIGLAAGFDKNAEIVLTLRKFGFGFIEVGTITPRPQEGNPKPRIFRLAKDRAIINRLGFNNSGFEVIDRNISRIHHFQHNFSQSKKIILGVNIGKNKDSADYLEDYLFLLKSFYVNASYITLNVSSPNTKNLRDIQNSQNLNSFLEQIMQNARDLSQKCLRKVPILLKIAPDLTLQEQKDIAEIALKQKVEGLIISNTTIDRDLNLKSQNQDEQGGLSGYPLNKKSDEILANFYQLTKGQIPIIGVGGVSNASDVYRKIKLGASLVQIYSAFIYEGFSLVEKIKKDLSLMVEEDGYENISQAVGASFKDNIL